MGKTTRKIFLQLRNNFRVAILKFFDADSGWKNFRSGIRDVYPGSATLDPD
jgi:hypothetical protein